jgi:predicted enzyme related to lactoylglutathione lyase
MKIKTMTLFVDDQEKALRLYTEKLGFVKKADFSQGEYRWLTVVSSADPNGVELVLERNTFVKGAQAYQEALRAQNRPGLMLFVDDVNKDYERLKAAGVTFTMPATKVTGSTIAQLDDTCGNLVQLTQLDAWAK